MKQNNNLLASVCYFSVFFLPFLLPIIVYFVTDEEFVKHHAKRSLVSHLVPVVLLIAGFIIMTFSLFTIDDYFLGEFSGTISFFGFIPVIFLSLYGLLFFIVMIWNVVQGVKLLK